jgi:hypothetical protein
MPLEQILQRMRNKAITDSLLCSGISIGYVPLLRLPTCECKTSSTEPCVTDLLFRFQGFDSGIYSIIISDSRFIDYFNVKGARSGVVASMGKSELP